MTELLLLLAITTMLLSALGLLLIKDSPSKRFCRTWSEASSWIAFLLGATFSISYFLKGSPIYSAGYLQITTLQAVLVPYILLMGVLVKRFSYHYLQTDSHYGEFFLKIKLLMAGLLLFVTANHVALVVLSWVVSGWVLVMLIRHTQTPSAIESSTMALNSFLLGDILLLAGLAGLTFSYQTPYLSQWFGGLSVGDPLPITSIIALVIGAMTKTAILPFHRWLPNTLTAPTPVSAIMHAGFVNSGAILFAKISPVLITQPWVMNGLVIVGLLSAVFGSAAMLVQSDVKRYLTFSTIGQMGFMILECGLGAFHLAIGHLIVHGLFKARLFLASGSVIEHRRYIRNVTLSQKKILGGGAYCWALLIGVIASTALSISLGLYFLPLSHNLESLHPLLGVMLILSVVFSSLALQKSKGVSLLSIVLSGLFGLALLSGYALYEGFAEHYLQAWNVMYLFNHSLFSTGVATIVSVFSGFVFLVMVGLLPVPQTIVQRLYMSLLNTSEEPVTPKNFTTTFSHRQAIQA